MRYCCSGDIELDCLLIIAEGIALAFMAIIVLRYSSSKNANVLFFSLYTTLAIYYGLTLATPEVNLKSFYFPVSIMGAPLAFTCSIVGISTAQIGRAHV